MFDLPFQQPQSVGDLLGRSFRIFRQNYKLFVRAQIAPCIGVTVGRIMLQFSGSAIIHAVQDGRFEINTLAVNGAVVLAGFIVTFISGVILILRNLAFVRLAVGLDREYAQAVAFVLQRKWIAIGVVVATLAVTIGAALLWMVEMIVSGVAWKVLPLLAVGGVTTGIIGFLFSLAAGHAFLFLGLSASICESESFSETVSRTFALIIRDLGRIFLFCFLLMVIMYLLGMALAVPLLIMSVIIFFKNGIPTEAAVKHWQMPGYYLVTSQVWESLVNMFVIPVTFIAYGLIYTDLRTRQDGLDILRGLKALSGPPGSESSQ
ncbi:MAG TPA: hypothetical protein V6C72_18710 [Chroococcales cyanobacterium]